MAARTHSLFDREIIVSAMVESFKKLNHVPINFSHSFFQRCIKNKLSFMGDYK